MSICNCMYCTTNISGSAGITVAECDLHFFSNLFCRNPGDEQPNHVCLQKLDMQVNTTGCHQGP